jgi:hypothetical protein
MSVANSDMRHQGALPSDEAAALLRLEERIPPAALALAVLRP